MSASNDPSRRRFLGRGAALGLALVVAPELLRAQTEAEVTEDQAEQVADEVIARAARLADLEFTPAEIELMRASVTEHLRNLRAIRALALDNSVPPATVFRPHGRALVPGLPRSGPEAANPAGARRAFRHGSWGNAPARPPRDEEALAFAPVAHLSRWIHERKIGCLELTEFYLERLRRLDPTLHFVIHYTEERARVQAMERDVEIRRGRSRGPLHGIPWGAKDLLAVRGYPTTWGAQPYREQRIDTDAAAVRRLDEAGAVLLAKTTVGALAWGDVWFGEKTRNPWNPEQGSSGSSAGSASAVAAGALPFALGTETLGSIVSPSSRCGASGLRPTFGRVSRAGCMALSWSMDKIGVLARSAEDTAMVLAAIHGADEDDPSSRSAPIHWLAPEDAGRVRWGYTPEAFEREEAEAEHDRRVLEVLRVQGLELEPIRLPDLPVGDMLVVLEAEAAAAFDELTRTDRDDELVRQVEQAWPNVFRAAQLVPAVQFIQAQRARTLLMRAMEESLGELAGYVCPSFAGPTLAITNLTGHPTVVVPNGFREDGTPTSISFVGRIDGEGAILALASVYQRATDWHRRHPTL